MLKKRNPPLHHRVSVLEDGHRALKEQVQILKGAMDDIKAKLALTPTLTDISELRSHFDTSLNTLLRDALAAVPQRAVVYLTAIIAILSAVTLVVYFFR